MSLLVGEGYLITVSETDIMCPICTFKFDVGDKMDNADHFIFDMQCPGCKGLIRIKIPIFGGTTECFEANPPKTIKDKVSVSPFKINGKIV
jgi:hypothetical protein